MPMPHDRYHRPRHMRASNGSARFAFVTFLMLNVNYLPGALMVAYGLRRQSTQAHLVCLVTADIRKDARDALAQVFDHVVEVPKIYVPHKRRQQRQDRPYYFTRLNALRVGRDGDLGLPYEKIVVLDADVLPLHYYDHLFSLRVPAGIINESKNHFVELDEFGNYHVPPDVEETGQWRWHRLYAVCPHSHRIPREITDRPGIDPTNMGINGSLFVLEPSLREFEAILADVKRPEIQTLVGDQFDWPDMQYLTMRWSGQWTNVDLRFSGFNGYPCVSVLHGIHFAGFKPWYFHRAKAMQRYRQHADFRLWFQGFHRMMTRDYPQLQRHRKLERLLRDVQSSLDQR